MNAKKKKKNSNSQYEIKTGKKSALGEIRTPSSSLWHYSPINYPLFG